MFVAWYTTKFFDKTDNVVMIIVDSLINVLQAVINCVKLVVNKIIKLLDK